MLIEIFLPGKRLKCDDYFKLNYVQQTNIKIILLKLLIKAHRLFSGIPDKKKT